MAIQPFLPFDEEEPASPSARLVEEIARIAAESPFEEKVLVAPSLAIGHEFVEQLARTGRTVVRLRVETLRSLALSVVGADLARRGIRLLSRAQSLALIEQACSEALPRSGSGNAAYFGAIADRPGLHRALQRTFQELRTAGILPDALRPEAFSDPRKHRELVAVLRRYEEALESGRFIDTAGMIRLAAESSKNSPPSGGKRLFLLSESLELSAVERELLDRLAKATVVRLPDDPPEEGFSRGRDARLYAGAGEENEIREVFRSIYEEGLRFDEAELVYTDSDVYPALVYELASEHGVPCTFAEGVAVTFTRPGRAALAFLEWIENGFEAAVLRRALTSGALSLPDDAAGGALAAARALAQADIGWGRRRHASCLAVMERELERERDAPPRDEEDEAERAVRRRRAERRIAGARAARRLVDRALELAPDGESVTMRVLARGVREFTREFSRLASELDGISSTGLEALFVELEELPPVPAHVREVVPRLADAVRTLHVNADRARPGHLHVTHFRHGGYAGRNRTFLVGLDEARHPGAEIEDPVLLDAERRAINLVAAPRELPLSTGGPMKNARALQAFLARTRGRIDASFPSYDLRRLAQPGPRFPAAAMLELLRARPSEKRADYERLAAVIGTPVSFVPRGSRCLDDVEWWLARRGGDGASIEVLVRRAHPWLEDGARAEEQRESSRFTEWDGWVHAAPAELDPRVNRQPVSCSRIETLARCPYMFFLRHVLEIRPVEERDRAAGQWLDPMETGSLLHEVFRAFFEEISAAGEKPSLSRHSARLEEIVRGEIEEWREKNPPRSEAAFAVRCEEILFAARTFLRLEEEHCREATPRYFEVPFGLARAAESRGLASTEPVEIDLGGGRSFFLRGCIDRIDQDADGRFAVWDYKTGSAAGVHEERGLRGGRQMQFALYAMAVEALLERAGIPGRVGRSGYFFPGKKGQGQRFAIPIDLAETRRLLSALFDLLADGAFIHTPEKDDCRFCDYQTVCGGLERATERALAKSEDVAPPVLTAFWSLNRRAGD